MQKKNDFFDLNYVAESNQTLSYPRQFLLV